MPPNFLEKPGMLRLISVSLDARHLGWEPNRGGEQLVARRQCHLAKLQRNRYALVAFYL